MAGFTAGRGGKMKGMGLLLVEDHESSRYCLKKAPQVCSIHLTIGDGGLGREGGPPLIEEGKRRGVIDSLQRKEMLWDLSSLKTSARLTV
jgi:hypothetical protein